MLRKADRSWRATVIQPAASFFAVILVLAAARHSAAGQVPISGPAADNASGVFERDLASANKGDAQAELRVARAYESATGTKRNYAEALKWFQAAAQQGVQEANAWLGSLYLYGHGVPQNSQRALELIQAAASANDPAGLRFLGVMYQNGFVVPVDYSKAMMLYSAAANKRDGNGFYRLGVLYLRGVGTARNPGKAFNAFTEGAQLGDAWSQLELGKMYEQGTQVEAGTVAGPNLLLAIKAYTQAAAQGNPAAAYRLAQIYKEGKGGVADYPKALAYYRQAAARGYAPAQFALGEWNELKGTPANLIQAYVWYGLASNRGNMNAAAHLDALAAKLNPEQVKEAQTRLSEWKSRVGAAED